MPAPDRRCARLVGALARLLPRGLCQLCALPSNTPLCAACLAQHFGDAVPRCPRCALRAPCGACVLAPPRFVRALALGDYTPPLDRLIERLKFGAQPRLGRWLGVQLAQRWHAAGLALPHCVVAVPLAPARLRERGYNQAWEIALGFAAALRLRVDAGALQRCRDTAAQSLLPRAARAANVRGAFVAHARPGTRMLLVDDVMTSGCTLDAAADALLRGGAAEVAVAVALRTPAPD